MANKKKEYTDKEQHDLVTEIKTGRRVFNSNKGLLQIKFPGVEETRLAEWEYSKVFNEAIMDEIPTNKEMERIIAKRNLWGEDEKNKIAELNKEIEKQIVVLEKMTEGSANYKKAEEKIFSLREEIIKMQQERQRYFNNTAESKAEEAKMSFLISKCTEVAETGKPLWENYKAFKAEEDQETVNKIVYQFITFINGLPADFLSESSDSDSETDSDTDSFDGSEPSE